MEGWNGSAGILGGWAMVGDGELDVEEEEVDGVFGMG